MSYQSIICGGNRHLGAKPIIYSCFSPMWAQPPIRKIFSMMHRLLVGLVAFFFCSKLIFHRHWVVGEGWGWLVGLVVVITIAAVTCLVSIISCKLGVQMLAVGGSSSVLHHHNQFSWWPAGKLSLAGSHRWARWS